MKYILNNKKLWFITVVGLILAQSWLICILFWGCISDKVISDSTGGIFKLLAILQIFPYGISLLSYTRITDKGIVNKACMGIIFILALLSIVVSLFSMFILFDMRGID